MEVSVLEGQTLQQSQFLWGKESCQQKTEVIVLSEVSLRKGSIVVRFFQKNVSMNTFIWVPRLHDQGILYEKIIIRLMSLKQNICLLQNRKLCGSSLVVACYVWYEDKYFTNEPLSLSCGKTGLAKFSDTLNLGPSDFRSNTVAVVVVRCCCYYSRY